MVDAFIRLMNTPDEFTGPMNLGNPHELTMLDIARRIIALTGFVVGHRVQALADGRSVASSAGHSLARDTLGWSPTTPLDEGLRRTAQHFRQVIEASECARGRSASRIVRAVTRADGRDQLRRGHRLRQVRLKARRLRAQARFGLGMPRQRDRGHALGKRRAAARLFLANESQDFIAVLLAAEHDIAEQHVRPLRASASARSLAIASSPDAHRHHMRAD